MTRDHGGAKQLAVKERNLVRPGLVIGSRTETLQPGGHFRDRSRHRKIRGIGQNADASVQGQRTSRPAPPAMSPKPLMGILKIWVRGIEERDQDVYVQEGDTQSAAHSESRNAFTSFRWGCRAPSLG